MSDDEEIAAPLPRGPGHRFAFYGDSCSGVPWALHIGAAAEEDCETRFEGALSVSVGEVGAMGLNWRIWTDVNL